MKPVANCQSLEEVLQQAIQHEDESFHYYMEAAALSRIPEVRRCLTELAAMELEHKEELTRQLERVKDAQHLANDLMYAFGEPEV